jgi:hypothetical protein
MGLAVVEGIDRPFRLSYDGNVDLKNGKAVFKIIYQKLSSFNYDDDSKRLLVRPLGMAKPPIFRYGSVTTPYDMRVIAMPYPRHQYWIDLALVGKPEDKIITTRLGVHPRYPQASTLYHLDSDGTKIFLSSVTTRTSMQVCKIRFQEEGARLLRGEPVEEQQMTDLAIYPEVVKYNEEHADEFRGTREDAEAATAARLERPHGAESASSTDDLDNQLPMPTEADKLKWSEVSQTFAP